MLNTLHKKTFRLAWWPHTQSTQVASFRLRCLQIKQGLEQRGYHTSFWQPGQPLPDVLIVSKRFDRESIQTLQQLTHNTKTRWVFDFCDNYFDIEHNDTFWNNKRLDLIEAVQRAHCVSTSSETLKQITTSYCQVPAEKICVIEDAIEPIQSPFSTRQQRINPIHLSKLLYYTWRFKTKLNTQTSRLIWFGNASSPHASGGLIDLAPHQHTLEQIHHDKPLHLTIVSNDYPLYQSLFLNWRIPTTYIPWSLNTFSWVLQQHQICLIPANLNQFTRCKTNNRLLTAIQHRLVPIYDPIPSYLVFDSFFSAGITEDTIRRAIHLNPTSQLNAANQFAQQQFSLNKILDHWEHLVAQQFRLVS